MENIILIALCLIACALQLYATIENRKAVRRMEAKIDKKITVSVTEFTRMPSLPKRATTGL